MFAKKLQRRHPRLNWKYDRVSSRNYAFQYFLAWNKGVLKLYFFLYTTRSLRPSDVYAGNEAHSFISLHPLVNAGVPSTGQSGGIGDVGGQVAPDGDETSANWLRNLAKRCARMFTRQAYGLSLIWKRNTERSFLIRPGKDSGYPHRVHTKYCCNAYN